jgi:hypothetical protein
MGAGEMINLRGESSWAFYTSAGGGGGIGPLIVSGGMFVLKDPDGKLQRFNYAGSGLGWSFPLPKLLRTPHLTLPTIMYKGQEIGATGATVDFPGEGIVYITEACHGSDLTPKQIEGGAIYFDAGIGWLRGFSGTIMMAGINPELLEAGVLIQRVMNLAISTAPAVIFMYGQNEGLQQSAGLDGMFGQISYKGLFAPREN